MANRRENKVEEKKEVKFNFLSVINSVAITDSERFILRKMFAKDKAEKTLENWKKEFSVKINRKLL